MQKPILTASPASSPKWSHRKKYRVEYAIWRAGGFAISKHVREALTTDFDTPMSRAALSLHIAALVKEGKVVRRARGVFSHTGDIFS